MDKFHVAARLPDAAKAPGQFTQAIAVNEIHAREIDQELLVAVAGEDMNKVAQLSATVSQRESSHNIDHNDAIELSRCDLKPHSCFYRLAFLPESDAVITTSQLGIFECFAFPKHEPPHPGLCSLLPERRPLGGILPAQLSAAPP